MLKIALPNGSLEKGTFQLFEDAGFSVVTQPRRHEAIINSSLFSNALITRPQRIPELVARESGYDLGICGQDCVWESGCENEVVEVMKLNFSRNTNGSVSIVLFTDNNNPVKAYEIRSGTEILTEYPNLTFNWFRKIGIKIKPIFSHGATESDVPAGYPFGVCVTETGKSIEANGLKIVDTICTSSTVLIANKKAIQQDKAKAKTIYTVKKLLLSALDARESVLVMFNVVAEKKDEVLKLIPSLKNPTISSLVGGASFAITSVIPKEKATSIMIEAMGVGAEDWIEVPINKLIRQW